MPQPRRQTLCLACGLMIGFAVWCDEISYFSPASLDRAEFLWTRKYRVIIVHSFLQQQQYKLSGTGDYGRHDLLNSRYHVPINKDAEAFWNWDFMEPFCDSEMTFIRPAATCAEQCPQSSFGPDGSCSNTHGYPIHAACWDIIERVIGPRVAEDENHLALLTKVLIERWHPRTFELEHCISNRSKQWVRNLAGYDNLTYAEWAPAHTDPTHVEEVSDIIENSISRCARKKTKTKTRRWRPCLDPNHSYIEEHLKSPSGLRLPANIEIRYLILDHLDYADVRNAFRAFGWRVPEGYFQRRSRRWIGSFSVWKWRG